MIARLMAMLYVSTVAPVAAQAQGGSQPAAHHETIVVHAGRLMTDPARPVAGPRSDLHRFAQQASRTEPLGGIGRQSGTASGASQVFRHRSRLPTGVT